MTALVDVPPANRATFRRSVLGASVVTAVVAVVLIGVGRPMFAVFLVVGVLLGALNMGLAVRAVVNFAHTRPSKVRFSGSVLARLAVVTVIALGCAIAFRPPGIAVFGGLALFQVAAVVCSMIPLIEEIRRT